MKSVRIVGIGSPSGDDQAGWLVVDALRALGAAETPGVALVKLDRPGAALLTQFDAAGHVILIDAMRAGGRPGGIRRLARAAWPTLAAGASSHGFGLADALALAESLGALPARIEVYGIEAVETEPGAALAPAVAAGAASLARRLARMLRARPEAP